MSKNIRYIYLLPCLVLFLFFLIIPLLNVIFPTVFGKDGFSFASYIAFFTDSYNVSILSRTLMIASVVTIFCALLGVPTAYFISRLSKKARGLLMALTLFPLLTNSVVRSFAWITILGKNGVVNNFLMGMGWIEQPMTLLYTEFAIIIGSIYLFLPTMIMTLVGVMENIDGYLLEAAQTLGAKPSKAFFKVVLPLTLPGVIVGSILVFTGTLTAYTTPQLLGGNKNTVLATLLNQKASTLADWQGAGVIALVMIVITLLVVNILNYLARQMDKRGGEHA